MAKPPCTDNLFIDGPAGRLAAMLEAPAEGAVSGAVVVMHPHPQHGGTMHNKVVHTLARGFVRMGFAALKFNFRGTDGSEGKFDEGQGELQDALAVADYMRAKYPDKPFWLAGFSFGAAISIRAAIEMSPDGLISVAPAVYRFADSFDRQPRLPWLIVQGDQDELVSVDETIDWVNTLEPGPELLVLPGVEHFFHGRLIDLRDAVIEFVERNR